MRWVLAAVGGAAAPAPVVRSAVIISGGFNPLPDTSGAWQPLSGYELALPASAGDYVEIGVDFLRTNTGGSYLDMAVRVGGALVRFAATGSSTPSVEGNPGWYQVSGFSSTPGPFGFTVTPGDLDGSDVRFTLACKGNGTGRLFADASYPLRWRALNLRAAS